MILVALLLVLTISLLLYIYLHKSIKFWANTKVKCLTPPTLLGAIKGTFGNYSVELYKFAPEEPYIGITTLAEPGISIRDPDLIQQILIKDFPSFQDRGNRTGDEKKDPLWPNLFFLVGKRWRVLRRKLSPALTSSSLRRMFPVAQQIVDQMVTTVSSYADEPKQLYIDDLLTRCTIDFVLKLSLGFEGKSMKDPDDYFFKMMKTHFKITPFIQFINNLLIAFPSVVKFIPQQQERKDINDFFLDPILKQIRQRKEENIKMPDFLNHFLEVQSEGLLSEGPEDKTPFEMTDMLIAAQAWGVYIAATGTTSNATAFAFVELANHPEVQDRVRQEVREVIETHGGITYAALKDMTYLDQVVDETLRLHPVIRIVRRTVSKEYTMPDGRVTLPVGTRVHIHIRSLHHDSKYYPDPQKFDPERFSPEAKSGRHKFVHIPFGAGPRVCIGTRFALVKMKLLIASLLSQFEFRPVPGSPYPPVLSTSFSLAALQHNFPVLVTRCNKIES